ncbi:MAG: VCBS repeat-containing protein [Chitinophagaceae bacterium]|nr:VCBS repeat-containing protein [Chitinophagaceae bacterium]
MAPFFLKKDADLIPVKKYILPLFLLPVCTAMLFFSCKEKKETAFESLSAAETHIDFENKLEQRDMFNILYYLYYYNGGGVSTGDINNDGLPDIYFTANSKGNNKLYLNKGNFVFEDITAKAGVAGSADWSSGVTMADVNGDGLMDIYVCASSLHHGLKGHNELFINNGNNTFTESAEKFGLNFSGFGTQAAFFDYDRDGDLDCYLLNHSQKPNSNIRDTTNRRQFDAVSGDRFYRNDLDSTGKFTDVSAAAGIYQSNLGYGLGIATGDFNNDGWDDIYVGNDFHENDYYYLNKGDGTFAESGADHFKHYSRFSMGNDAADYNNDGQLDLITVDMLPQDEKVLKTYGSDENPDTYKYKLMGHGYQNQYSKNALQRNNGNGSSFSETALQSGVAATDWSWAPLFADFDNDGNKDLFISSGIVKRPVDMDYIRFVSDLVMKQNSSETSKLDKEAIENMPDGSSHPYFYKGDGKINFTDVSESWGTASMKGYFNGASYADLNNDGNLDMVINCLNARAMILKNKLPAKNTLDLVFKGNDKNTNGIGVKAWIYTKGKMQYQQLMSSRGFQSSCDLKLHFGLDSIRYIDSMLIVWPNQKYQRFKNTPAKGLIEINQAHAGGYFDYNTFFPPAKQPFENISSQVACTWTHHENDFLDFNKQYLTPHMQSTRGPRLAVADVNKDGLDDFFVCGASGQPGQLMVQTSTGKFISTDTALFAKTKQSEEADAIFFDANNDGAADLYVVSGGNQYDDNDANLADHLYMNDGKGHFSLAESAIPAILKNKSCVTVSDIDKDGDQDLFVGGLADAKRFGIAQPSYLLLNDGKGIFKTAGAAVIKLESLGIVTSASFTDLNNDGWNDLVVAGEWMAVKIFINKNGKFVASEIPASTGLWQTVYTTDVNGDGFMDILAGNWGHNSKLYSGKNGPLKLYVKDFDGNGSVEQVMAYTVNEKEYTFLAKDELERSLPVLKKAYLKYSEVAGKTVDYMFYDLFKDYTTLKAETLGSCYFINDGKGNFNKRELPDEIQMAPVFSFTSLSANNKGPYMAAGNFYGVVPYEGRYDALLPSAFVFTRPPNDFKMMVTMPFADGEVRDAKWIRYAGGKQVLIVAQNNKGLIFLKPNE